MPRSHGVIKNQIWEPVSDFRHLHLDQQWAYLMLISQPQINNLGLLPHLPDKWLRLADDLDQQRLQQALDALEQARYTITDHTTHELLVRTFIRHDGIWKQPKLVTSARRLWREVESDRIREQLQTQHPWLADTTWTNARIRTHEQRHTPPTRTTETPSHTPTDTPSETPSERSTETPSDTPSETPSAAKGVNEPLNDGVRARTRDALPQPLPQPQGSNSETSTTTTPATTHETDVVVEPPDPQTTTSDEPAELDELLDQLAIHGQLRQQAHQHPDRALAVARYTRDRGAGAGYYRRVFESGNWPDPEPPKPGDSSAVNQPARWQPGQPLRYLDQARAVWRSMNGDGRSEAEVWLRGFTDDPAELAAHLDVLEVEFRQDAGLASAG